MDAKSRRLKRKRSPEFTTQAERDRIWAEQKRLDKEDEPRQTTIMRCLDFLYYVQLNILSTLGPSTLRFFLHHDLLTN